MLFTSSNESGIGGGWYVLAAAVEPYIITDVQCHVDSDSIQHFGTCTLGWLSRDTYNYV